MESHLILERIAALIHQSVRDDAARHGLQSIHVQILGYLARANRYSDMPIAVAEYLGITRGTVSQSLKVLEDKGLIRRRPDPRHGRRVHLELTAAGRSILEHGWSGRLQAALAAQESAQHGLGDALRELLRGLQQANRQRPFGICHQCAHFLVEADGHRCGLTGEALHDEQTQKICREWTQPDSRAA
ncbi:MAG: MarR family transcriptional regulator [Wenzhouxiangellaceae bacterium]|nr:MarR family transcriptional regulator [Wenzhouxiangellaceae bacterium]